MKFKRFALILVAMIVFGMLPGTSALAETGGVKGVTDGMDVVILLDSSKSMSENATNDGEYRRLDAAVMMINMCATDNCSVAVVPYISGDKLLDGSKWGRFIDVSSVDERTELCNAVIRCETKGGGDSTNGKSADLTYFSASFRKAIELMRESVSKNPDRRRVVLLLTDGVCDDKDAELDPLSDELNTMVDSVYGILLHRDPNGNEGLRASDKIRRYIYSAGGVSKDKLFFDGRSEDIVSLFSRVFAQEIGSKTDSISAVRDGDNISIDLYIPNNSIYETNIQIPLKAVRSARSIEITDPNGNDKSDEVLVYEHSESSKNNKFTYDFVSVKLMKPTAGLWRITFPGTEGALSTFSCDLLYNYSISLAGTISAEVLHFNDTLEVRANFVDTKGAPSADEFLYHPLDNDGHGLTAELVISKDGEEIATCPMTPNAEELCFEASVALEDMRKDPTWTYDDEYTVNVHVEGDCLVRDLVETKAFTLENRAPVCDRESLIAEDVLGEFDLYIDNIEGEDPATATFDASVYFCDEDSDTLTYTIESDSEGFAEIDAETGIVTLNIPETIGEAPEKAYSFDVCVKDRVATARMTVGATVVSEKNKLNAIMSDPSVELVHVDIRMSGANGELADGDTVNKGDTITCEYTIVPNDTLQIEYPEFEKYLNPSAIEGRVTTTVEGEGFEQGATGNVYTYTFGDKEETATITASALLSGEGVSDGDFEVACTPNRISIASVNRVPVAVETAQTAIDNNIDDADGRVRALNAAEYFFDEDAGNDVLTYTAPAQYRNTDGFFVAFGRNVLRTIGWAGKEERTEAFDIATEDGTNYMLDLAAVGAYDVLMTVTDNDGATAEVTVIVSSRSPKENLFVLLLYVLIAVVLVIIAVVLFIRLVIHRPWPTTKHASFEAIVERDPVNMGGKSKFMFGRTGRRATTLKDLCHFKIGGSEMDEIVKNALREITLWPTLGYGITVVYKRGKGSTRIAALNVNGEDIYRNGKGGKATWRTGGSLVVKVKYGNSGETVEVSLKRVENNPTAGRDSYTPSSSGTSTARKKF